MKEFHDYDEEESFLELQSLVIGETANDDDHQLLQELGYSLLNMYGVTEVFGQYGYRTETGTIVFNSCQTTDETLVTLKVLDQYYCDEEEPAELLSITFNGHNSVCASNMIESIRGRHVYDVLTGIFMDVSHQAELPQSITSILCRILELSDEEEDQDSLNNFWQIPVDEALGSDHAANILRDYIDSSVNIRLKVNHFSAADDKTEITIESNEYVGDVDEMEQAMLPKLVITHVDREKFEELRYLVYADGDTECIGIDPRHEEFADIMTSVTSVEEEQEIDEEVDTILGNAEMFTLSKHSYDKLAKVLINVSIYGEVTQP